MLLRTSIIKPTKAPISSKRNRKQIFIDKIVDPAKEPTLFNIESARMSVEAKTGPIQDIKELRKPKSIKSNRRDVVARETLAKLNVTATQHTETFSLLEDNSDKNTVRNYRIMDVKDFENTINLQVVAKDKFPHNNDPFYQLDESIRTPRVYKTVTTSGGDFKREPDLSFILSNLTILNQKSTYHGKSKYF
jgi:hypothetical protein